MYTYIFKKEYTQGFCLGFVLVGFCFLNIGILFATF